MSHKTRLGGVGQTTARVGTWEPRELVGRRAPLCTGIGCDSDTICEGYVTSVEMAGIWLLKTHATEAVPPAGHTKHRHPHQTSMLHRA